MRRVYLDHNATTPVDPRVLEEMLPYLRETYGNPSSIHGLGQAARRGLDEARGRVAAFLNVEPREILFTSGGTEADNLAIQGVVGEALARGRRPVHVICSAIEHAAVLAPCEALASPASGGGAETVRVSALPVDGDGVVRMDELERLIGGETVLVAVMHANNELGTVQPVERIAALCRERNVLFHCDAVQSAGKIELDARKVGCDLLAISSHKIYGPKGVGCLWLRRGLRLRPLQTGGHQEREIRTGTENLPGIVGFGKACEIAGTELSEASPRVAGLRDRLESRVQAEVPRVRVNGARARRVPNTSNVAFEGLEGEAVVLGLDLEGIACSTGSACTSGSVEPSHVLTALGLPPPLAVAAVRFSLGKSTTQEDVDAAVAAVGKVVARLRSTAPVAA